MDTNDLRCWCALTPQIYIHTYRQNLLSSLKTTDRHSTLQSTLSWHQSSRAWRCHGVCGSLTRGTSDRSPAASRQFPMVLFNIAGATCALIFSLDAYQATTASCIMCRSWHASVLCSHPEPDLWVWECSTDHCLKQWHTTDTLCPTCAAIHQYVHSAFHRPTQFKKLKLFNSSTY